MNEPIYQAWRTITPVEGEPIPCWTQHKTARQRKWSSYASDGVFSPDCRDHEWRVRVPVIPEDVAVNAVMHNAFEVNGDNSWIVEIDGQREYRADTKDQLRELVIAKLRELSQGESCN